MPAPLKLASLFVAILIAMPATPFASDDASGLLELWQSSRVSEVTQVGRDEIDAVEILFARSLDRPIDAATARQWSELGFIIETRRLAGDPCHLLYESDRARRGRGMFLLCPTRTRAATLLVPHGFHDRFTAEIGAHFATEGQFKAVAWNTRQRHQAADHGSNSRQDDTKRETESYFTALVRAASVLGLPGPMIELHGFAPDRRSTEAGRSARAILSSGTEAPHRSTLEISACLEPRLGEGLLVYPTEVSELGGTLNRVAAVLRDWGRRDFLHLELSFALRKKLLVDDSARRSVIDCIGGTAR